MGLVEKFLFEKRSARGCSNSDYTFAVTTCCELIGVVDDELHDFYWDAEDLGRAVSFLDGSVCPACSSSDWSLSHLDTFAQVPSQWLWACERGTLRDSDRERPRFQIGERVRVILNERNRTPHEGTILRAIWHFRDSCWHYFLQEGGAKVSKRYAAEDLVPAHQDPNTRRPRS